MAKSIKPREVTIGVGQFLEVGLLSEGKASEYIHPTVRTQGSRAPLVQQVKEGWCYVSGNNALIRYAGMLNDRVFDLDIYSKKEKDYMGGRREVTVNDSGRIHLPTSSPQLEIMVEPANKKAKRKMMSIEVVKVDPLNLTLKCYEAQPAEEE